MFAKTLKVSPILNATKGATKFQAYFPKGKWVNMADFSEIIDGKDDMADLQVRDTVNVHLAPGGLISFQDNGDMSIMTTYDALRKPIMLVVNRDTDNKFAQGTLFLDKGESKAEIQNEDWEYYRIYAQAHSIQVKGWKHYTGKQPHQLDKIALVNADDLKDTDFACYYRPDSLQPVVMTPLYNGA
jgi:alpha-glucosidase (family GH31 glycosyl hydrolase)